MLSSLSYILAVSLLSRALASPTGPPVDQHPTLCSDMLPKHEQHEPQDSDPPFSLTASEECLEAGATITLTLQSTNEMGFNGTFIQAGTGASWAARVLTGTFMVEDEALQTLSCNNGNNNALGHSERLMRDRIQFQWKAPDNLDASVHFGGTVVRVAPTFWANHRMLTLEMCSVSAMIRGSLLTTLLVSLAVIKKIIV